MLFVHTATYPWAGPNIRRRRKALGLSQREVARRIEVSLPTYNRAERHGAMTERTLRLIAGALGCTPEELQRIEIICT